MPIATPTSTRSPKMTELRANNQSHLRGDPETGRDCRLENKAAAHCVARIRMAQAHAPDSDAADVFKQNNRERADFTPSTGLA